MFKHNFGRINQIHFDNKNQFYEMLGYLAKSGPTSIVW